MRIETYYNPKSITSILTKAAIDAFKMTEHCTYNITTISSTRRRYIVQYHSSWKDIEVLIVVRDFETHSIIAIAKVIDTRGCEP